MSAESTSSYQWHEITAKRLKQAQERVNEIENRHILARTALVLAGARWGARSNLEYAKSRYENMITFSDKERGDAEDEGRTYYAGHEAYQKTSWRLAQEISDLKPPNGYRKGLDTQVPIEPAKIQPFVDRVDGIGNRPGLTMENRARGLAVLDRILPLLEPPVDAGEDANPADYGGDIYLDDTSGGGDGLLVPMNIGDRVPRFDVAYRTPGEAIARAQERGLKHLLTMRTSFRTLAEEEDSSLPRYTTIGYMPLTSETAADITGILPDVNGQRYKRDDNPGWLEFDFAVVAQSPWDDLVE